MAQRLEQKGEGRDRCRRRSHRLQRRRIDETAHPFDSTDRHRRPPAAAAAAQVPLKARSRRTGKMTKEPQSPRFSDGSQTSALPKGTPVAVGVTADGLRGVVLSSGKIWKSNQRVDARPAISGDVVVGTGAGKVFALDANTGSTLWTADSEGRHPPRGRRRWADDRRCPRRLQRSRKRARGDRSQGQRGHRTARTETARCASRSRRRRVRPLGQPVRFRHRSRGRRRSWPSTFAHPSLTRHQHRRRALLR